MFQSEGMKSANWYYKQIPKEFCVRQDQRTYMCHMTARSGTGSVYHMTTNDRTLVHTWIGVPKSQSMPQPWRHEVDDPVRSWIFKGLLAIEVQRVT